MFGLNHRTKSDLNLLMAKRNPGTTTGHILQFYASITSLLNVNCRELSILINLLIKHLMLTLMADQANHRVFSGSLRAIYYT